MAFPLLCSALPVLFFLALLHDAVLGAEANDGVVLSPAIKELVARLENPKDPAEREEGLNGLLALGDDGLAILRDRLSCKNARTVFVASLDKPVVRPGERVSVRVALKTAVSGVLWVPHILNPESFLDCWEPTLKGFGESRPNVEVGFDGGAGGAFPKPAEAATANPIRKWKPMGSGETICEMARDISIDGVGYRRVTVRSNLRAKPPRSSYPASISPTNPVTKQPVRLEIGAAIRPENIQEAVEVLVFGLPDLNDLPGDRRLRLEMKPRANRLGPNEFHLEVTVGLRSLIKDSKLIVEQDLARYAWILWLDEKSMPHGWRSWESAAISWKPEALQSKRILPGESCQWSIKVPRPEQAGTFRLLAGYYVEPGGANIGDVTPPVFVPHGHVDGTRIQDCGVYFLSDPVVVEPANVRVWRPRDDLPPLTIKGEVTLETWLKALERTEILHQREFEVLTEEGLHEQFAHALFFAEGLADGDIRKVLTYYHCGAALLAQSEIQVDFRPFNSPYLDYCATVASRLANESLQPDDALRTACLLLQTRGLLYRGKMEEARDILDRLEPDLKANKEQLHWDWVYFLSARAKCLVEEDKSEAALKLLEDSFPWIEKELGPDNDGLLLLLPKAIEIARKLKRQEMVTELERMLARLNANRDKYGSGPVDLVNKRLAEGKELVKARRAEEAEKVFLEACTLARYVSWSETTEQVAEFALQQIYASQGELELALKYARRGLAFCERSTRRESGDLAFTEAQVGRLLVALGRKHDGVRYLKRALQSLERMQENESDLYRRLQREMEAAK